MDEYTPAELGASLLQGGAVVLPYVGAAVAGAVALLLLFLGIRKGIEFFRDAAEFRRAYAGGFEASAEYAAAKDAFYLDAFAGAPARWDYADGIQGEVEWTQANDRYWEEVNDRFTESMDDHGLGDARNTSGLW